MKKYQYEIINEIIFEYPFEKNLIREDCLIEISRDYKKSFEEILEKSGLTPTEISSFCQKWREEEKKRQIKFAFDDFEGDNKKLTESIILRCQGVDETPDDEITNESFVLDYETLTYHICGKEIPPEDVYSPEEFKKWQSEIAELPEQLNEMEEMYHYIFSHLYKK